MTENLNRVSDLYVGIFDLMTKEERRECIKYLCEEGSPIIYGTKKKEK